MAREIGQSEHQLKLIRGNLEQTMLTADRMAGALSASMSIWRGRDPSSASLGLINGILDRYSSIIPNSALYLMDSSGNTLASSNRETPSSFVGHNFAFREYFQSALARGQGTMVAMGSLTGIPGYYSAFRVNGPDEEPLGVAVVKVEMGIFTFAGASMGPAFLVNREGGVLASSTPGYVLHLIWPADLGALQSPWRAGPCLM